MNKVPGPQRPGPLGFNIYWWDAQLNEHSLNPSLDYQLTYCIYHENTIEHHEVHITFRSFTDFDNKTEWKCFQLVVTFPIEGNKLNCF